jgi:uncharacterized membrane protein YhaH (DUF805 family)
VKLNPIQWALRPLKNYANFSGRASRAEFWWFFLFMILFFSAFWMALFAVLGATGASVNSGQHFGMIGALGTVGILLGVCYLALLIPAIAVQTRRLHDTNRSGWWLGAFYILYVVHIAVAFGSGLASASSGGSPPDMSGLVAIGVIAFVVMIYGIVLLVFYCLPGTQGPNRFGDDPYGADVREVFA